MPIILSDVSNALEKVIQPFITDNFDKTTPLLDSIKKNTNVTFFNDNFYAPVRTSRNGGITNLADDGNSLVSGSSSIGQASVAVKTLTGTFDISKLTMDATKSRKGAVENQLTFQARSLSSDFAKDTNRQYYSNGSGMIAQVGGSVGAGTIGLVYPDANIDDGRAGTWYGSINGDIAHAKYIQPKNIIGIGTAGADVGTVTTASGTTVVVTGAPAIVASDVIFRLDGDAEGDGTAEIQGMREALSDSTGTSTYAAVARSTNGWTPQLGTVSEALSLSKMEDKYLASLEYGQSADRYAIFVNKTLYKKYGDILTSMRRTVNTAELLGGWSGLEFQMGKGKVGVFLDFDVPDGEVLIVNMDSWTVCQVSPMSWAEDPASGKPLIRRRDKITYQATMVWFTNLICTAPGANGRLAQKSD